MVASGLPAADRRRVIFIGIVAATVMRILFAVVTVQLMKIVGLVLAGGLLLLWVCWKLWREIEDRRKESAAASSLAELGVMPRWKMHFPKSHRKPSFKLSKIPA